MKKRFISNSITKANKNLKLGKQVITSRLNNVKNLEIKKRRSKSGRSFNQVFVPGFNLFFLGSRNNRMNKKLDIFVVASGKKKKFTNLDMLTQMYLVKLSSFAVKRKSEEVLSKKNYSLKILKEEKKEDKSK